MLSLLFLLAAPQQVAPGPTYQMRYRFQSNTETTIDMSALMAGMKSSLGLDSAAMAAMPAIPTPNIPPARSLVLLTVQARDSAGGRAAHIIIDSIATTQFDMIKTSLDKLPAGMSDSLKKALTDAMKSAAGETLDVFAVPGRQLTVKLSAPGSAQMAIVSLALQMLFPPMKVGTVVGQVWTDTVSTDTLISASGMDLQPKSTVITEWKMLTGTLFEGNVTSTNSIDMGAALGSGEGGSTGKTRLVLDKNRWVVEAGSSTKTDMKVKLAIAGDAGMTMSQASTVSLMRIP